MERKARKYKDDLQRKFKRKDKVEIQQPKSGRVDFETRD